MTEQMFIASDNGQTELIMKEEEGRLTRCWESRVGEEKTKYLG